MTPIEEWIVEAGKFNRASLELHQQAGRVRDALIDQMSELVEAVARMTDDPDLMAGWAARLLIVADVDIDHAG